MVKAGISRSGREDLAAVTSRGRRLVTIDDVVADLGLPRSDAAGKLARWAEQGWLRRVRRGLYIPVPVDVEQPDLWSEDPFILADAIWSPCYFTGWTAANHWGLTEQIFRTIVVKTTSRVRAANQRLLDHDYLVGHVSGAAFGWGLRRAWRQEHRVMLTDEPRTVVEMLNDPRLGGGIRHIAEMLDTYLTNFEPEPLITYGDRMGNSAIFKRLGYLAEALALGKGELLTECRARIGVGVSLLDPSVPSRGPLASKWALRANVRLEASTG